VALTILSYVMIIAFMYVIMTKKLSPLTALVMVPLAFAIITLISGVASPPVDSTTGQVGSMNIGDWVTSGLKTTSNTGIMLLFAILYFSIMLDAGMFDPITNKMIGLAKGDPMRVLMATAIVAACVSLNGDGTTTTLICCTAFLPIYKKLHMKVMNLGVLVILQNTIMNLLPWGGPTARAMAVFGVGSEILAYLLPGMIISVLFVIFVVARHMGKQERERLGIIQMSNEEISSLTVSDDPETAAIKRPNLFIFNLTLTLILIIWLVAGSFIDSISLPSSMLFIVGTCIALLVNYPSLKDQADRIEANGGAAVQVIALIFGAGIFMGLFQGSGMADALAQSLVNIIPKQLAGFWGIIIALISAPGTFFLSNDGFYFGVMPALAQAGYAYGFTSMQMALASLMGQAFHLLSPLVAFIYLLLRLLGLDMGEWQRASAKWALCIFGIFVVTILATGQVPIYIAQ
jgi:CitMHS family citrate-Mg2+:H+ or citrate-Ca2+:H+ symporter